MSANYAFAQCELRTAERQLLVGGEPAALGPRAFDLLLALVERRERVVAKAELLDAVWPGLVVEENNLQVQVSSLRKVLGTNAIATVPGRGYRFVAELRTDSSDAPDAPPTSASPTNLRRSHSRFVGREKALSQCASLLRETQLLTLSGIGGCGKTRLAQELAWRELSAYPDGVWFVDLSSQQEARGVVAAIAAILGVDHDSDRPLAALTERLTSQRMLIVLDNCEHVIDAVVESIEAILAGGSALRVVATSREALGVAGEQVFAVRSLALPESADFDAIGQSEAVRLFIDRARLLQADFTLDHGNADTIAEICRRLDGIALAIELAAARVRVLSIGDIQARLDDRFRLLTGGSRALPRHQTLQATMQWSYDHLTTPEQRLFRRLAVFAGGSTLAATVQVAGDSDDEYHALELLTALHDKSLLMVDRDTSTRPRYRMLETVRQYAEERLNEAGEGPDIRTRHLLHFVALAETLADDLKGPRAAIANAALLPEATNLVAALGWSTHAPGGADLAMRLVGSAWRHWRANNEPERGYRLARAALDLAGECPDTKHRYFALHALAKFALATGRYADIQSSAELCVAMARRMNDPELIATALEISAIGLNMVGNPEEAFIRFSEGCEFARSRGDRASHASCLHNMAEIRRSTGDLAEAEALYRAALAVRREFDGPHARTATTLVGLAILLIVAGRTVEARAALAESLQIQRETRDRQDTDLVVETVATLAAALGDHSIAARLHGSVLALMREARTQHEPVDEAFFAPRIAAVRAVVGDTAFDAAAAAGMGLGHEALLAEVEQWLGSFAGA